MLFLKNRTCFIEKNESSTRSQNEKVFETFENYITTFNFHIFKIKMSNAD